MTYDNVEDFQVYTLSTITSGGASSSTCRDTRSRARPTTRGDRSGGRGSSSSSSLTSLGSGSSEEEEEEEEEEEVMIQTPRQRSKATLTQKGKSEASKNGRWNGLSVEGMIFVALCSGGDYHPVSESLKDMAEVMAELIRLGWKRRC